MIGRLRLIWQVLRLYDLRTGIAKRWILSRRIPSLLHDWLRGRYLSLRPKPKSRVNLRYRLRGRTQRSRAKRYQGAAWIISGTQSRIAKNRS
ncbi:MAG: hypothetical protein JWO08_3642 [Verrucomicrobiaceae bacterium]|nr:hypothetical protein [Verrucomicrobiaceae bacterium]